MMKKTILLLALVALSFCAETATERYDDALYMIYSGGFDYLNVYPYMEFTSTLRLSVDDPDTRVIYAGPGGTRSDLQDGAIVCEGPITAQLTPGGIWARGGNLEQTLNYYQRDPPTYSGGVNANRPIFWSSSVYDAFYTKETCTEDESCWSRLSGLVLQPADFVRSGEWFYNRESRTNVVCKGTASLREGSALLSSSVIEGTPVTNTNTYLRGSHTFTGQMDINGCAAVVRHPEFPEPYVSREEIYSRTEARSGTSAPQYSGVAGPVSINVRSVVNDDLRCQAEFVSIRPSPLNVTPGGSTGVTITIRNNCDPSDPLCQDITVNRITVSEGFRFTSISMIGTSFTARPGRTVTISGSLTAPDDEAICTAIRRSLTFTAEYSCMGCEGMAGEIPRTMSYQVGYDCPDLTREQPNLVPRFDPDMSRYDIPTGERPNITIITRNVGDNDSNTGETCVAIGTWVSTGTGFPDWVPADPGNPLETFYYPALAPGEEEAHPRLSFECTPEMENKTYTIMVGVDCALETNESNEDDNYDSRAIRCVPPDTPPPGDGNGTYNCDIAPSLVTGSPGTEYGFDLRCPEDGDPLGICTGDVDWSVTERGNATYEDYTDYIDSIRVLVGTDTGAGSIHIEANVEYPDGNATCSSDIIVPVVPCEEFV